MIDSTDQKPRRERDEIREQGAELIERQAMIGNQKHSVKDGAPQGPGRGLRVWVALGVENKGREGGGGALSRVDTVAMRADGLSRKLLF